MEYHIPRPYKKSTVPAGVLKEFPFQLGQSSSEPYALNSGACLDVGLNYSNGVIYIGKENGNYRGYIGIIGYSILALNSNPRILNRKSLAREPNTHTRLRGSRGLGLT